MNCSKERAGSIVTETLKIDILTPIYTSDESDFYTDFKYMSITNLVLPIKSYEPDTICLIFRRKGETSPKSHTIRFSVSENSTVEVSSSYLQKCGILYSFVRRKITDACLFVYLFFFFFRGDCIDPEVLECRERAHSNGN